MCPSLAWAQTRPARAYLDWKVPPAAGCIPQRELEPQVEAMLGRSVFASQAQADHVLLGTAARSGERWIASLSLVTRAGRAIGRRELSVDGECAELNRPLVVVMATMLDTTDTQESLPKAPEQASLGLGLALVAESGVLPRLGLGAAVSGELTPSAAWPPTRLSFTGFVPQRAAESGVGAKFIAFQAALALCPVLLRAGPLRLAACLGVELGMMHAQAVGLSPPRTPSRLLAAVPLEASVSVQVLAHLALRIGLTGSLNALRPAFYLQDEHAERQVVHQVGLLAGGMQIGFIADAL